MGDTETPRVLGARQTVNRDPQKPLLADLPFHVENLEAQRARYPLRRLTNLFQLHAIQRAD
jgi:hypothetical protein